MATEQDIHKYKAWDNYLDFIFSLEKISASEY